jgi:hypothetical protein
MMMTDKTPKRDNRGRWRANSSGNPRGRPRAINTTGFDEDLHVFGATIVEMTVGGQPVQLTISEALNHKLYHAAMKGDTRAALALRKAIDDANDRYSTMIGEVLALTQEIHHLPASEEKDALFEILLRSSDALESIANRVRIKNRSYSNDRRKQEQRHKTAAQKRRQSKIDPLS